MKELGQANGYANEIRPKSQGGANMKKKRTSFEHGGGTLGGRVSGTIVA